VPHVHFHVIPRHAGLELKLHAAQAAETAQLRELAERIKAAMPKDD
jgi:histidine triad (HIT) family protein